MSKNFELMQQAGKEQALRPSPAQEPEPKRHSGNGHGNGNGKRHRESGRVSISICWLGKKLCASCSECSCCKRKSRRTWLCSPALTTETVAAAICVSVAETLAKNIPGSVCLVEANLRSPALPEMFGTTNHHGLTDALLQDGPIRSFAKRFAVKICGCYPAAHWRQTLRIF